MDVSRLRCKAGLVLLRNRRILLGTSVCGAWSSRHISNALQQMRIIRDVRHKRVTSCVAKKLPLLQTPPTAAAARAEALAVASLKPALKHGDGEDKRPVKERGGGKETRGRAGRGTKPARQMGPLILPSRWASFV